MKISKIFAGMSAMAIAATMLSVSASAAITNGDNDGNVVLDIPNYLLDNELQDYVNAEDIVAVKVTFGGEIEVITNDDGNTLTVIGGDGYGGGIIVNHGAGWDQQGWGNEGQDNNVEWNEDETEFFIIRDITGVISAEDISAEEGTWCQIVVCQWWGGDFSVESIQLLDADGNDVIAAAEAAAKADREAAAADALAELEKAINDLGLEETIASMNAAAEALTNAADVLAKADELKGKISELEETLAKAEAAFAALKEGDEADTEALAAAKAAVESAAADLEAAQTALNEAMAAYDKATADALAEKDKTIADLEAANKTLEEEKAALEAELAALKESGEADAAKIAELEAAIAAKEEEIAKLKAEKEALEAEKAQLEADLADAIANGGNGGNSGSDDKDANPATGAGALATVGILLAGAAVVVSKRK